MTTLDHLKAVLIALTEQGKTTSDLTRATFQAFLHVERLEGRDAMLPDQYKGVDHD